MSADEVLDLPPRPESVREARRFVRRTLADLQQGDEVIAPAVLLVSELTTNAILHANSGVRVHVGLEPTDEALRVEVHDDDRTPPVRRQPGPDDASGRGLVLLESLAEQWGVVDDDCGKTVWFELPCDEAPAR